MTFIQWVRRNVAPLAKQSGVGVRLRYANRVSFNLPEVGLVPNSIRTNSFWRSAMQVACPYSSVYPFAALSKTPKSEDNSFRRVNRSGRAVHRLGRPVREEHCASPSAWMAKALGGTMCSSSASGAASNTRRYICGPMKASVMHAPRLAARRHDTRSGLLHPAALPLGSLTPADQIGRAHV